MAKLCQSFEGPHVSPKLAKGHQLYLVLGFTVTAKINVRTYYQSITALTAHEIQAEINPVCELQFTAQVLITKRSKYVLDPYNLIMINDFTFKHFSV
jgi:hypothetical protein